MNSFDSIKHEAVRFGWKVVVDRIVKRLADSVAERGLPKSIEQYVRDSLNVEYQFQQSDNNEAQRKRLNTESGLIISNHPDFVDIPAILTTLSNESLSRFKVIVAPLFLASFRKHFEATLGGREMFVSYTGKRRDEYGQLKDLILGHVQKNDGLFLIFPTGGKERHSGVFQFNNLFRDIVLELDNTKMIYNFCVEPNDVEEFVSRVGKIPLVGGLASLPFLPPGLNVVKLLTRKKKSCIHVDERYTQAEEWKGLITPNAQSTQIRKQHNQILTNHYLDLFRRVAVDFQKQY